MEGDGKENAFWNLFCFSITKRTLLLHILRLRPLSNLLVIASFFYIYAWNDLIPGMALQISHHCEGLLIELPLKVIDFDEVTLAGLCWFPALPGNMTCLCKNTHSYHDAMF